jgi:hypothetical protein
MSILQIEDSPKSPPLFLIPIKLEGIDDLQLTGVCEVSNAALRAKKALLLVRSILGNMKTRI